MTTIKLPLVIDVSSYQQGMELSKLIPVPSVCIAKVSEGTGLYDKSCAGFLTQARAINIPFAFYHFYHNEQNSGAQAKFFWSCVQQAGGVQKGDRLVLDFEQNNNLLSAHAIVDFCYNVNLLSGIAWSDFILSSTAGILNGMNPKAADIPYLKQLTVWSAGYPNDPDQFNSVPSIYTANSNYGSTLMWQYSESAPGIGDASWIDASYLAKWKSEYAVIPTPVPTPTPTPVPTPVPTIQTTTGTHWTLSSDGPTITITLEK